MKRILSLFLAASLLFLLCSCKYTSSYRAIGLVRSNNSHSCKASFLSLDRELVFKLKKTDSEAEGSQQQPKLNPPKAAQIRAIS